MRKKNKIDTLTVEEKEKIANVFTEIFKIKGFEYVYIAGWCNSGGADPEYKNAVPVALSPVTGPLFQNDYNKMRMDCQKNKTTFYKIIKKNLFLLNKMGLSAVNNPNEIIANNYICLFAGSDNERNEALTTKSCLNMLYLWLNTFFDDYREYIKIISPLNSNGNLLTTGRTMAAYVVPNSKLVDDFYMFAFNAFCAASINILNDLENAEIMQERLQSYNRNYYINVFTSHLTPCSQQAAGVDYGIIKFEKVQKGNAANNVIIEKRVVNDPEIDGSSNIFINYAAVNKYKKLYMYMLQQVVEQQRNNISINIYDIVTKGIYSDTHNAFKGLKSFLRYQKTFTVIKYNNCNVGTILFQYAELPERMPANGIVRLWVTDAIAGALLSNKTEGHILNNITMFPQFAYNLDGAAFDIVRHICYTMRQNGAEINKKGYYVVTMRTFAEKLFLPVDDEADFLTRKNKSTAKQKLLNAIKQINDNSGGIIKIDICGNVSGVGYCEMLETITTQITVNEAMIKKSIESAKNHLEKSKNNSFNGGKKKNKKGR